MVAIIVKTSGDLIFVDDKLKIKTASLKNLYTHNTELSTKPVIISNKTGDLID